MSFLKKLFGAGGSNDKGAASFAEIEHEGYLIRPAPMKEGSQFRICGTVSKEIDGQVREHRLIRADLFPSADEAAEAMIRKAKQVIREQGEKIFR